MAALQARAFAEAGQAALLLDLFGCGDSSGDFGEATWSHCVADVLQACPWLQTQVPAPLWSWGLRAGCLLASEATRRLDQACNLLFWQLRNSGKQLLEQFLRLKLAGDMVAGNTRGAMNALRAELATAGAGGLPATF